MNTYNEARQKLAALLDKAKKEEIIDILSESKKAIINKPKTLKRY